MGYENNDIRKFVAICREEAMNEVFSPMKSLADYGEVDLREAKHEAVETLVEAFVGHMGQSGIDVTSAPIELLEAIRFVVNKAFECGYYAAVDTVDNGETGI